MAIHFCSIADLSSNLVQNLDEHILETHKNYETYNKKLIMAYSNTTYLVSISALLNKSTKRTTVVEANAS